MGSSPAPLSNNNQNAAETRWGTQRLPSASSDRLCARVHALRDEKPLRKGHSTLEQTQQRPRSIHVTRR